MQEAVRGGYAEICQLLSDHGAKLIEEGNLVPLADSSVASVVNLRRVADLEFGIEAEWEIHASELKVLNKLGEGEFGEVFKARYHGTFVAVKQLKSSDQIAMGDFRTEMGTLRKLHHPNAVQFLGACTRKQPYLIVTELMSCSLSTAFNLLFSLTLRRQVRAHAEPAFDVSA
jgi:Protein tyrosine and serine/threonine kinase